MIESNKHFYVIINLIISKLNEHNYFNYSNDLKYAKNSGDCSSEIFPVILKTLQNIPNDIIYEINLENEIHESITALKQALNIK